MDVLTMQFYMGLHLENKGFFYANANCKHVLDTQDWMASLGFNHVSMVLKKPKLEKLDSKSTSTNPNSPKSTLTSFICLFSDVGQPKKHVFINYNPRPKYA